MSLRAFHVFFISISILLCAFLIYWAVAQNSTPMLAFASIAGVALAGYLTWFLKKT